MEAEPTVPGQDPLATPDERIAELETELSKMKTLLHDLASAYLRTNLSLSEYVRESGTDVTVTLGPDQKPFTEWLDEDWDAVINTWAAEDGG